MQTNHHDAAVAAIQFALKTGDGLKFLQLWNEGEFDKVRSGWPDAPEQIYIGADSQHPDTPKEPGCQEEDAPLLSDDAMFELANTHRSSRTEDRGTYMFLPDKLRNFVNAIRSAKVQPVQE